MPPLIPITRRLHSTPAKITGNPNTRMFLIVKTISRANDRYRQASGTVDPGPVTNCNASPTSASQGHSISRSDRLRSRPPNRNPMAKITAMQITISLIGVLSESSSPTEAPLQRTRPPSGSG